MSIQQWPTLERPREKLLRQGRAALSDAELLAIFLRTGIPGKTAVDIARDLLQHFGSLRGLLQASFAEFSNFKGLGEVKYVQFQALLELSQRYLQEKIEKNMTLSRHEDTVNFLTLKLRDLKQEMLVCLFLDTQHQLIAYEELFKGTLNKTAIYPREIVQRALHHHAAAVIIAHNHPSGLCEPSDDDILMTHQIKKALALLEIPLYDHLIIGEDKAFSFAERGWM